MSQKPVTMEQLKQILQLKNDGVAIREIARRTGISRNAIKRYLLRLNVYSGDGNPTIPKHGNPSFRGMVTPPLAGGFLLGLSF